MLPLSVLVAVTPLHTIYYYKTPLLPYIQADATAVLVAAMSKEAARKLKEAEAAAEGGDEAAQAAVEAAKAELERATPPVMKHVRKSLVRPAPDHARKTGWCPGIRLTRLTGSLRRPRVGICGDFFRALVLMHGCYVCPCIRCCGRCR